jgi:assimilatory nitrate reductase catalytic subunit
MITGQGNGQGGREHGQKCDQLPGQRSIADPGRARARGAGLGHRPEEIPQAGYSAVEIMEAIHRGEIKGLLSICFNPLVSLPDANYTREALEKLEFFGVVDFFMSETARHADVVLAGSLQEEDEGVVANVEGRVLHIRQAVTPPGDAREDWRIYCDLAARLGKGRFFPYDSARAIFDELREASRGGPADYSGITYEKIDRQMGVFWPCPSEDHPARRGCSRTAGPSIPTARMRFLVTEWRPSGDPVDEQFPVYLTTGRVVSQYLSARRRGASGAWWTRTPSRASRSTRAWRRRWACATATG